MEVRFKKWQGWLLLAFGLSGSATADFYHYNNFLIGDKASGMGGAYGAISDDASGIFYNPAGLAFSLSNDISGSANAFYKRELTYKEAIYGQDFKEISEGPISPFVGVLGKLDYLWEGLVFSFAMLTPDSEQKNQNDLFKNPPNAPGVRFHRTAIKKATSSKTGVAVARRMSSRFSMGLGMSYYTIDELEQVYQDFSAFLVGSDDTIYSAIQTSNVRQEVSLAGMESTLGFQWALTNKLYSGLTLRKTFIMSEKAITDVESAKFVMDQTRSAVLGYDSTTLDQNNKAAFEGRAVNENVETEKPFGDMPLQARLAFAYFASQRTLLAYDLQYNSGVDQSDSLFKRQSVMNHHLGIEQYLTANIPMRVGFFTNYDVREKPGADNTSEESVDFYGADLFFSYAQPNSQLSAGVIYQIGQGKAKKVASSAEIQEVEGYSTTLAFSVSHNF